jgi:hypothetical protein
VALFAEKSLEKVHLSGTPPRIHLSPMLNEWKISCLLESSMVTTIVASPPSVSPGTSQVIFPVGERPRAATAKAPA